MEVFKYCGISTLIASFLITGYGIKKLFSSEQHVSKDAATLLATVGSVPYLFTSAILFLNYKEMLMIK